MFLTYQQKKKNYPNYKGQLIIAVWGNNRSLF